MTNEEIISAIRRNENVTENMELLYMQNLPMIYKIAKKFAIRVELEDLLQEGYLGLVRAVELWDPERDSLFMTYAVYWIRQAIARYANDHSTLIRVPVHQRDVMRAYSRMANSYRVRFGRDPEEAEIRLALNLSHEQYMQLLTDFRTVNTRSSSVQIGDDGESTLEDFIQDKNDPIGDAIERIAKEEEAAALWSEVDRLPEREAEVIRSRFREDLTLKQCSEALGVSTERIRQLQEKALRKLRSPKVQKRLSPYLTESASYSIGIQGSLNMFRSKHLTGPERAVIMLESRTGPLWGKQKEDFTMLNKKDIERIGSELLQMEREYPEATFTRKREIDQYHKELREKYTSRERSLISDWVRTRKRIIQKLRDPLDPADLQRIRRI